MRRTPWRITHILDPWVYDALQQRRPKPEFRLIPEPVEPLPHITRDDARRELNVPTDGHYIAMVGGLTPGKGIEELLAAFAAAKLPADNRLLLLGKMKPEIRQVVGRYESLIQQQRLVCVDRYVTDFELDCGFVAADIVAVVHRRIIGSSGTLVRAAHAGRMLLTTDYGWAGWATRQFQLGTTVNVGDAGALTDAIEQVFAASPSYQRSESGDRFCRYHSLQNQKAHWVAGIGRDLGIPLGQLNERIDWNWALGRDKVSRDLPAAKRPLGQPA
jgi:glycosyltransferase involved in cell wall biosynthesis